MKMLPLYLALATLAVLVGCGAGSSEGSSAGKPIKAAVAYVVDGDTLRVRLASGDLDYVRLVAMLSRVSRPNPSSPRSGWGVKERPVGLPQFLFL